MMVIQMSGQELTRLRIMIDLADGRITAEVAATLMGLGRARFSGCGEHSRLKAHRL